MRIPGGWSGPLVAGGSGLRLVGADLIFAR
jgi:hypothetical protein